MAMIAPQELRLGNYFQETTSKEIIEVESISKDKIGFSGYFTKGWQAEPIELTEEWLEKFGFKQLDQNDSFYIFVENYNLKISHDLEMVAWHNLLIHDFKPKYVHQLQNLYFALTGEELTIKEQS